MDTSKYKYPESFQSKKTPFTEGERKYKKHPNYMPFGNAVGSCWEDVSPFTYKSCFMDHAECQQEDADPKNPRCINYALRFDKLEIKELFQVDEQNQVIRDQYGAPLNPWFATGISGRGSLPKWGPNIEVVVIVFVKNKKGKYQVIYVEDCEGDLALPSGQMKARLSKECDYFSSDNKVRYVSENLYETAQRELKEQTGLQLPVSRFRCYHKKYPCFADLRNTDNAWLYANLVVASIEEEALKQWNEEVQLIRVTEKNLELFSHHHSDWVRFGIHVSAI